MQKHRIKYLCKFSHLRQFSRFFFSRNRKYYFFMKNNIILELKFLKIFPGTENTNVSDESLIGTIERENGGNGQTIMTNLFLQKFQLTCGTFLTLRKKILK